MSSYDFQRCAKHILKTGQSVLIIAPTGLGKTRAALQPFIQALNGNSVFERLLGTRLIYTLPLRVLARGVEEELQGLNASLRPVVHHGDEPESQFFSERCIITTIDQYLTAFAGAPLSWASHLSHAAAGAVLTSYSVFDEVHLLSAQKGLPLLFAMLYLRKRWGLLSCVMTATLPPSVINFLEYCGLVKKIEASDSDIQQRDGWRKVSLELVGSRHQGSSFSWDEKNETTLAEFVQEKWEQWSRLDVDGPQKIIVFVNTVDRAVKVYEELSQKSLTNAPKVLLAHSRFTQDDRRQVEDNLQCYFGKQSSQDPAILVTTQVAEAGLNISAPLVITELCPMDSLIQRAGRCQRFKPNTEGEMRGKVLVVKPAGKEWYVPYNDRVRLVEIATKKKKGKEKETAIELTRLTLEREVHDLPLNLDWAKEQDLIQKSLDRLYGAYLSGTTDLEFQSGQEPFQSLYNLYKKKEAEEGEEFPEPEEEAE